MCNSVGPWFAEAVLNIVLSPRTTLPVVRVRMLTAVEAGSVTGRLRRG